MIGKEHCCKKCGRPKSQSFRYDADYCANCDTWLSAKCSTGDCMYCCERPVKPSLVYPNERTRVDHP